MQNVRWLFGIVILYAYCAQPIYAEQPPYRLSSKNGNQSVTLGFLAQPQFELLKNATGTDLSNNLFFRRLRFIAGGKLTSKLSYFAESDAANLGKEGTDGKRIQDFYLQDAYLNYAFRQEFQLDAGMLLLPLSHNSGQSAATLLPIDYGPYSFMA